MVPLLQFLLLNFCRFCNRYLASGDSMKSMSYAFLVAESTVSQVVRDTCDILWEQLKDVVFQPVSEEMWRDVADEFEAKWDFPHCVGALDGKHCVVQVCLYQDHRCSELI